MPAPLTLQPKSLGLSRDATRERKEAKTKKRGISRKLTPAMKTSRNGKTKKRGLSTKLTPAMKASRKVKKKTAAKKPKPATN